MKAESTEEHKTEEGDRYGFWKTFIIVISGHIGVRTRKKREEDFARANGLYVFIVAATYFLLVITALIFFVRNLAT